MSHTVKIKTQIKERSILIKAIESMGWFVAYNQKKRTYATDPDRNKNYEIVAVNPAGNFDVGFALVDGVWDASADFYDRTIEQQLGTTVDKLGKLKQEYGYQLIKDEYETEGYSVDKAYNAKGELVVEVTK